MASNAASSVQFRVNGTEMARGRTRKTERSQSMDPRAKPRAAGRLKGKRRDNRDEREFILGPENAGNFCIARRSRGISAIVSRRLPRTGLLARNDFWFVRYSSALHRKSFFFACTKKVRPSSKAIVVNSANSTAEAAPLH